MKDGFRQSMAWLHTWAGLVCGWLLCAIFFTGSISVFRDPITRWMQATPVVPAAQADAPLALGQALEHLAAKAAGARFWRIELPTHPGDAMLLAWQPAGGGRGSQQVAPMDPTTGALLPTPWGRKTEGGRHFMSFHYMLHLPTLGYWLVGWVSVCALVALVSGVVVHRRIFADFFTFRPRKGQRSWLDAHNATGVLTLPFLFMIVYTGVAFFYSSYMPWPLESVYGTDKPFPRYQAELAQSNKPAPTRPRAGKPAELHDLAPLLRSAESTLGRPARMVLIDQPGDSSMLVRVYANTKDNATSGTILNFAGIVTFDGVTGAELHVQRPEPPAQFSSDQVHGVMKALHVVNFGGWAMKWLYFISGLLGTAMVATGTILFMVKRRKKSEQEFGAATARVYRVIEALNVTCMAGVCVASIAYFYGNRLLPADLPGREVWEIRIFLWTWGAALLHALLRPPARAWTEQFAAAAALCLALPLLNHFATGQQLGLYLATGDWLRASVELTAIALGLLCACFAYRIHRKGQAPVRAPASKARPLALPEVGA